MTIRKTLFGAASVAALALAVTAAPAAADGTYVESTAAPAASDAREFAWSITVGGTSDYIFRGLSLSNEDPAAQGSIDFSYGIFYAGAWASNVSDYTSDNLYGPWELDLYAGVKPVWGPVTFDFGVIGYLYPAADDSGEYIEFKAAGAMEIFKGLNGNVQFFYTPDQENYSEGYTIEGNLAYGLPQVGIFAPTITGGIGYTEADAAGFFGPSDNYTYWNAGLVVGVEKFVFDFRYWDTDLDSSGGPGEIYTGLDDERFVFTAKVTLP